VELRGRLNRDQVQRDPAANMVFTVPGTIASLTRLLPGDVLVNDTPAGVGFTGKPPVDLKPGDVLKPRDVFEVEIPGAALLRNPVIAQQEAGI
jgi:2-keto-4-pentenoate hydratase/2-oxohepta-3-ene-1,7-dioic acid hydratase in catechol pathway